MHNGRRCIEWAPPQRDRDELLDAGHASRHAVEASLADLRRINAWLGNTRILVQETLAFLEERGLREATILDIGTGSGDLPRSLLHAAKARGIELRIIGLDCKPAHLITAKQLNGAQNTGITLLTGDAFQLPLRDWGVDLVLSSLFLHHFRPPEIERLLCEFSRVARHGWIMNDLVRHIVPLLFFKATWPVFARSYLTRHDGVASFRRGYTVEEMQGLLASMNLPVNTYEVKAPFFRMLVVAQK